MSAEPAPPPRPGFGDACALSALAWLLSVMASAPLLGWASPVTALAVGAVLGFGGIGTLVARRLPPPVDERLGLRGFPLAFLGVLVLLAVPTAILASELDNVVKALLPAAAEPGEPTGEPADPATADSPEATAWILVEAVIVMVLLRPVVEEFFFRGVLLQGLAARHGAGAGIAIAAFLSAACEALLVIPSGSVVFASVGVQALFVGALLGGVRIATGSLLAPILLLAATRGFGGLSVALAERMPIPGFNAPGDHTPAAFLLPALACAALGAILVRRAWRAREADVNTPEHGCPESTDRID